MMKTSITVCLKAPVLTELGSRPLTWPLITEQRSTVLHCAEAIVLMSLEEFRKSPVECWPCVSSTIRWQPSHICFLGGSCPIKSFKSQCWCLKNNPLALHSHCRLPSISGYTPAPTPPGATEQDWCWCIIHKQAAPASNSRSPCFICLPLPPQRW